MGAPSSKKLSQILVDCLFPALPPGAALRAEDGSVSVYIHEEWQGTSGAPSIAEDNDGRSVHELLEAAIQAALSSIQDSILSGTGERWPRINEQVVDSIPEVNIEGNIIHFGYVALTGTGSLRLSSVDISQVISDSVDGK